jgi:hypothetical protein
MACTRAKIINKHWWASAWLGYAIIERCSVTTTLQRSSKLSVVTFLRLWQPALDEWLLRFQFRVTTVARRRIAEIRNLLVSSLRLPNA